MNLLPFDLEKVKAGAKFCDCDRAIPVDYEITRLGLAVIWPEGHCLYAPDEFDCLRILPEEREVWINVWLFDGMLYTSNHKTEEHAKNDAAQPNADWKHLETIHKTYTI